MYTILICDDDRDIVSALDIYLTSEGYRTIAAYNGREAIQAAEENEIHLILMDVMMPELDGIRATAKLREGSNVPIILLTAKSEDTDKILGLNIGADDYITKPFNPLEDVYKRQGWRSCAGWRMRTWTGPCCWGWRPPSRRCGTAGSPSTPIPSGPGTG